MKFNEIKTTNYLLLILLIILFLRIPTFFTPLIQSDEAYHSIRANVMLSGNESLLMFAACEGMGFSFMPHWLVDEELAAGRLEHVLPDLAKPTAPLFAVYPDRSYLPAKVRSFLDFLVAAGFPGNTS